MNFTFFPPSAEKKAVKKQKKKVKSEKEIKKNMKQKKIFTPPVVTDVNWLEAHEMSRRIRHFRVTRLKWLNARSAALVFPCVVVNCKSKARI